MRCESGSVKRGGNEIGCASPESGAQPIDLLSYDGCFRGSRGQVGCHLRSSLESLGWDFERVVSPSTPSSDRCRRGRSGFFCMRAISLLQPPLCWNIFLEHVQQMCMRYRRSSQIGVRQNDCRCGERGGSDAWQQERRGVRRGEAEHRNCAAGSRRRCWCKRADG